MFEQWQLFPPEANYWKLVTGAGPTPSLAAAEAYAVHASAIGATVGASLGLAPATAEGFVGMGGTVSQAALVTHNSEHTNLGANAEVFSQIHHMAAAAHPATVAQMVPAPVAHANRIEEQFDVDINPLVWGMLTPRIADLEMEYFGFMWPNNASAGLRYGATLDALGTALMTPSMPAISGGSIAAAAIAAATVAESAAMSGMQAAVGMVGSGVSAVAGPAAALPASAMSAMTSSGSSTTSPPANSVAAQPLSAVTYSAPPTPAQTYSPAQSSTGMYAPSPNANLMVPPPVPPTAAQPPVQPMMPRPPVTPPMSAAPGLTSFAKPAEPFSPPPPSGGKAVGLKPGMLNASALRGPVAAMPASTATLTQPLTTASSIATQPLAYVAPQHPLPPAPSTPPQPPLLSPGNTAQTLAPPPQPQQAPQSPPHTPPQPPQQQQPPAQPQQQPPAQPQPNPNVGDAPNQGVQNLIGDLKDTPAQALSVHNSQDVHNIVDPLPPGESPFVHELPTPEAIKGLFDQLTENAGPAPPSTYPGEERLLPDGTRISFRTDSKSGGATVDIRYPDGEWAKVHLPKPKPPPEPAPQPAPEPHPVQVPATQTPAPETHEPVHDDPGHQIHVDPPPPGFWATVGGIVLGGLAVLGSLGQALE